MDRLDETSRVYSYPSRVKFIGQDLVLTTRDFFVIISGTDVDIIRNSVIGEHKQVIIQNGNLLVYKKDKYVVIEQIRENEINRILMVNPSVFV